VGATSSCMTEFEAKNIAVAMRLKNKPHFLFLDLRLEHSALVPRIPRPYDPCGREYVRKMWTESMIQDKRVHRRGSWRHLAGKYRDTRSPFTGGRRVSL
jgi:hypothetical protein